MQTSTRGHRRLTKPLALLALVGVIVLGTTGCYGIQFLPDKPAAEPSKPTIGSISTSPDNDNALVVPVSSRVHGSALTKAEYSTDGGRTWAQSDKMTSPFVIDRTSTGMPLNRSTVYQITVRLTNGVGTSPVAEVRSGQLTMAPAKVPAVSINVEGTTATVSLPAVSAVPRAERFVLAYVNGEPAAEPTTVRLGARNTYTIRDLKPFSEYQIAVWAENAYGQGFPQFEAITTGAPVVATDPTEQPLPASGGTITVGDDSITVNLDVLPEGAATWMVGIGTNAENFTDIRRTTDSSMAFEGLAPGTYVVAWVAADAAEENYFSEPRIVDGVEVKGRPAITVPEVTIVDGAVSIALPELPDGAVDWGIGWRLSGDQDGEYTVEYTAAGSFRIDGLVPGTYEVLVAPHLGDEAYDEASTFTVTID